VNTCVDIGCGPGFRAQLILERADKYLGLDISRSAIELARRLYKNNPKMAFSLSDASKIEIEDKSVDLIFCSELIEHIKDNISVFKEFHRILKPTGRIFITTTTFYYYLAHVLILFGYQDICKKLDLPLFFRRLNLYFKGFKGAEERALFMKEGLGRTDHLHAFTYPELKEIFDKTGFKILRYDYFNCKDIFPTKIFFPLNWALKKLFRISKIYGPNIALALKPA